jgi:hypothetical protein
MMLGGLCHEHVLLDPLEAAFGKRNAETSRQVPVRLGAKLGFVDLVVQLGSGRLAIEAEMTPRRVVNDLHKAAALEATWLWVVVPNCRVARSVRTQLRKLGVPERRPWISVWTLGEAIQQVVNCFPLFSPS